jgi:large subunit ribosomal protein L18Ae
MKVNAELKQYEVIGRKRPTKNETVPPLYKMTIFAPNQSVATSRFWYFLSSLKKMKKATGQIVNIKEVHEKRSGVIRNYGIWLRYDSRSGTHNMYREIRDLSLTGAVTTLYREMAARHRCRDRSIQIIRTDIVPAKDCKRPATLQLLNNSIKFPLPHRRVASQFKSRFVAKRPSTFFG